jgi:hypothetical protein
MSKSGLFISADKYSSLDSLNFRPGKVDLLTCLLLMASTRLSLPMALSGETCRAASSISAMYFFNASIPPAISSPTDFLSSSHSV